MGGQSSSVASNRFLYFFFNDTATTEIYTLSLHDALPIRDPVILQEVAREIDPRCPECRVPVRRLLRPSGRAAGRYGLRDRRGDRVRRAACPPTRRDSIT